jgi:hypothetical protein
MDCPIGVDPEVWATLPPEIKAEFKSGAASAGPAPPPSKPGGAVEVVEILSSDDEGGGAGGGDMKMPAKRAVEPPLVDVDEGEDEEGEEEPEVKKPRLGVALGMDSGQGWRMSVTQDGELEETLHELDRMVGGWVGGWVSMRGCGWVCTRAPRSASWHLIARCSAL